MELPNFPFRDQLSEATTDGQVDENARANCVCASLAAGLTFETGRAYYGDMVKDAVYGQGYTGATDPNKDIAYAQSQGVLLTPFVSASGDALVGAIRHQLATGHPAMGAIPSQWGLYTAADVAAHGYPTHEVIFYGDDGTNLIAMNPWHGFKHVMPYAWWASRLVYDRVHLLQRIVIVSYTRDAQGALHYPNGVVVIGFMAQEIVRSGLSETPLCGEQWPNTQTGFIPFDGGTILSIHRDDQGNFSPVQRNEGGTLALGFWQSLEAARSQLHQLQQRQSLTPVQQSAIAEIVAAAPALAGL